ncbi:DUF1700 domain-containing protein [Paenibacillus sp. P96]|uniref:DUF1700 domain-containing protein n=1 Tax=Paenibacillus zeirhizosphaerae TaxID=2987519 RepID=A0ABT9FN67_9BACL|nr:DUF1700 domain-containing protein [Paenibacillus sp. P96]MDP4096183.1 DUF1700 domain-containing protein [Paenibacillus sp. P96]
MNRQQFLNELEQRLAPLPAEAKHELLEDMNQHYEFGLQQGKSEEEISRALGRPEDIAKEALGYAGAQPEAFRQARPAGDRVRTFFTACGLIFLNLILGLPLFAVCWTLWVALGAVMTAFTLAPAAVAAEVIVYRTFNISEFFLSLILTGIGMLLFIAVRYLLKHMLRATVAYWHWNINTIKGK